MIILFRSLLINQKIPSGYLTKLWKIPHLQTSFALNTCYFGGNVQCFLAWKVVFWSLFTAFFSGFHLTISGYFTPKYWLGFLSLLTSPSCLGFTSSPMPPVAPKWSSRVVFVGSIPRCFLGSNRSNMEPSSFLEASSSFPEPSNFHGILNQLFLFFLDHTWTKIRNDGGSLLLVISPKAMSHHFWSIFP